MGAVLEMTCAYSAEQQVRDLLRAWVAYRRRWRPDNGLPSAVCWIDEVMGAIDGWTDGDDYDSRIHATEMRHVDEAIRSLSSDHQHALFVIYLGEIGPAVWRSGRKPMGEIRTLCDAAERHLVPLLKRRNVVF